MSTGTRALEPFDAPVTGVVVLIPILIGGPCMHYTVLLSHPSRVRVLIDEMVTLVKNGVMT
jgi:hypothetical protein